MSMTPVSSLSSTFSSMNSAIWAELEIINQNSHTSSSSSSYTALETTISDDEQEEKDDLVTILSTTDTRSETEKDAHLFALFFPLMSAQDKADNLMTTNLMAKDTQKNYLDLIKKHLDTETKQEFEAFCTKYIDSRNTEVNETL